MSTKKSKASKKSTDGLVDRKLIKALGHPLRTRILAILNEKKTSPSDLAAELGVSVGDTSYHVKVLRDTGFIEMVETAPRRGAVEHYYRAVHRALLPPDAWKELPAGVQQTIAADTFRKLIEDAGDALQANAYSKRPGSHVSWTPMVLDEEGWQAFAALLSETLERAFDLQAEANERMAEANGSGSGAISVTLGLAGFESTRDPKDEVKPAATKR